MHQPMEQIKIIKLINGDDIVCSFPKKQLEQKSPLIRIVKPLLIKYVPQLTPMGFKDYIALIKWAAYTNDSVITIPKDKILTITNASSEMGKSYEHMAVNCDKIDVKDILYTNSANQKKSDQLIFNCEENSKIGYTFYSTLNYIIFFMFLHKFFPRVR